VLAEGHQWGVFPSVAAAWRINQEEFLKEVSWLSNLKLRLSWGISGNSAISPYQTTGGVSQTYYTFGNQSAVGYYPSSMGNKDLRWESTSSYNAALDFGLFDNRINGNVDVFFSKTYDLLMNAQIPNTSGFSSVMKNVGKTEGRGIDMTLNALIIKNHDFSWSTDLNLTHFKDKIVALNSGQTKDEGNGWFVGEPVSVYYDYKFAGIWQISEYAEAQKYGLTYGQIKIADSDGNGTLNEDDRILYNRTPEYIFGMGHNFTYKNFDFSMFLYGRANYWVNCGFLSPGRANAQTNYYVHSDYWTPENQTNAYPRPTEKEYSFQYGGTIGYVDGSFLKIRDCTLGYSLPSKYLSRFKVSNLRFYASLKNFFTFSHVKDYDIERGGSASFPLTRQMIVGLNINF